MLACLLLSGGAWAGDLARVLQLDVPADTLSAALRSLARQADVQISFPPEDVAGLRSASVSGRYSARDALSALLKGTQLTAIEQGDDSVVVRRQSPTPASHSARASSAALATAPVAPEAEPAESVDEIVVTAQKRLQSVQEVPISVAVLGSEALEKRRIQNFSDLSVAIPSLQIPERGGGGDRFIFLRGLSSIQGSTPLVGVYLDEASVTSFPGSALDLQVYDIERVEVLRGPQGTLYGVGSAGGTVRFITKDPVLDAFGAQADTSLSATRGGDPSKEVRGLLNVPLLNDRLAVRLAAVYNSSGGWMDQPALSRKDINDSELVNVRAKMLWKVSDTLDVRASAMVHRDDAGAPSTGEDSQGNYTQAFFDPTTPSGKHDYNFYNLTLEKQINDLKLLSTTSYSDVSRDQREIGYRVPFGTDPSLRFHAKFDEDTNANLFTQELRLSSATPAGLNWLVGAFYRDAELHEAFPDFKFGPPDAPFFFDIETRTETRSWALFGETSYPVLDRLELGVGLRYFEDDQKGFDLVADRQQQASFHALSPRFFARYKAAEHVQMYVSAAKGFRSGGLAGGLGVRPFQPDVLWSYEFGTKMTQFDGRLSAEAALFYSDYKGVQVDSVNLVNGDLTQFTSNAGDAKIKGFDWDIAWHATDRLSAGLAGELIDTKFVRINAIAASHAVGDRLDFIPRHHVSFWSSVDFDWSHDLRGYLRLDYSQRGPSRYGNRTICECYESYSDKIDMVNAAIGMERGNWSAVLYGRNLLNERGYIDAEVIEEIAARARPRTIGVQVSVSLGTERR